MLRWVRGVDSFKYSYRVCVPQLERRPRLVLSVSEELWEMRDSEAVSYDFDILRFMLNGLSKVSSREDWVLKWPGW